MSRASSAPQTASANPRTAARSIVFHALNSLWRFFRTRAFSFKPSFRGACRPHAPAAVGPAGSAPARAEKRAERSRASLPSRSIAAS